MADIESTYRAWKRSPVDYLDSLPPAASVPDRPFSVYVPMKDGCRIAVDVYCPQAGPGETPLPPRLPTIVLFTCYYRRFALRPGAAGVDPNPNTGRYRDFFVARGYCVVVVDVRGTGASFGTRDAFRSPRERLDSYEIADWIVRQPWSDGTIGSTGVSYVGAASTFLASTGHPAVKAVAPICAVWDSFGDHFYPGGAPTRLAEVNNDMAKGLDQNRPELLGRFAYFSNPAFDGPQPVDDDPEGVLLAAATAEHHDNFVMSHFWNEFRFSDDSLLYDPSFTPASISPNGYLDGYRDDLAVYSISGWYDGAGFANSAISRFLTLANGRRHLLLGGWDHGARINTSPWRDHIEPKFPVLGEILRFFDHYVRGVATGLEQEDPVHYFSLHAETWRGSASWPPARNEHILHLAPKEGLELIPPPEGSAAYQVRFGVGTGNNTRFERLLALDCRDYYADWDGREADMLSFTSAPLEDAVEIAGHPLVVLKMTSSQPDAAIHLYLSEVDATGRSRYVTEGVVRACHHREETPPPNYRANWPYRSFSRGSATLLTPGEPITVRLPLFPVAWRFEKGSRIRISLSGADSDHFAQIPHGRPPRFEVFLGAAGSSLRLPVLGSSSAATLFHPTPGSDHAQPTPPRHP